MDDFNAIHDVIDRISADARLQGNPLQEPVLDILTHIAWVDYEATPRAAAEARRYFKAMQPLLLELLTPFQAPRRRSA